MAPRVFCIRHGETEWSLSGQHTGTTDIPLLPQGAFQASEKGRLYVGKGKLVDPSKIKHIFCSPRKRAQDTMDLVLGASKWEIPKENIQIDDRIREWTYGDYEGLTPKEILAKREGKPFKIWRDGCPNGESPQDMEKRVDSLIADIRAIHKEALETGDDADVIVFGHGHSLRVFFCRWLGVDLENYIPIVLPPAGLGILSYEHNNIEEPSLYLG